MTQGRVYHRMVVDVFSSESHKKTCYLVKSARLMLQYSGLDAVKFVLVKSVNSLKAWV